MIKKTHYKTEEMIENGYPFDFSVIMSVYNVEQYIEEAVESIVHQTIGFNNIQLILVDDGSTDGSGTICDRYKQKYPEQVTVIHKENGGLSSARNTGLPHVQGQYVSFFDPDDILDLDAFSKVKLFFEQHEEADICCIPLELFGLQSGAHILNYKFDEGTCVVDLTMDENAHYILLSCASSFFRFSVIKNVQFDTEIYTAEDAKIILALLMNNSHLGLIADTFYHYRKHGSSILDAHSEKNAWYLVYLKHFSEWAFNTAQNTFGYVPKFVQHTVMYDLQWKLRPSHIPADVMTEEDAKKYQSLLFQLASSMDDDVILFQKNLPEEIKSFLLWKKHVSVSEHQAAQDKNESGDLLTDVLESLVTRIHFIRFEGENLIIEGSQFLIDDGSNVSVRVALGNMLSITAEAIPFNQEVFSADEQIGKRYYFKATLPLNGLDLKEKKNISFQTIYACHLIQQKNIATEQYAPISSRLHNSYFISHRFLLTFERGEIQIVEIGSNVTWIHAKQEIKFLKELARRHDRAAKKAFFARIAFYILKPFVHRNIWLVTDKADRADDNGEAFFRYLVSLGKDAKCQPVFAVGKGTQAYRELREIGKVIPYLSWRFKMTQLLAQHTISAYSDGEINNPFGKYAYYYCDLMQRNKVVFLQHGITKDDVSAALNRFNKNYSLFITAVKPEWDSIIGGNYGYCKDQVILSGFPRYDLLYSNTKKCITVMPTWKRELCGQFLPKESRWELLPGFEHSKYYHFYSDLLNNDRLLSEAQRLGYTIRFLIHPVFLPHVERFKLDNRVEVFHQDVCYRDVFAESALITTDYSSVAFDFAYLKKPVIYTHFEDNHYAEGYFDYERDGFGEIEHTVEDTVDRLIEYMNSGCRLKPQYEERINRFFRYHDQDNCKRVYEAILHLDNKHDCSL